MANGYLFISPCSQELWGALIEILGRSPGYNPPKGTLQAYFKGTGVPLLKVFAKNWGESDERYKGFETTLTQLHYLLGKWDELSDEYWNSKHEERRPQLAQDANDLARDIVEQLRRNRELRGELKAQWHVQDATDVDLEFNDVCWRVAEAMIVNLECMWEGGRNFVESAWSLSALTRDLPEPVTEEGTFKTLADSWLTSIFERWKAETDNGTKPGPMDKTLKQARALVERIEKLQALLDDDNSKRKEVQKQLDKLVEEATDMSAELHVEAQGRGYGKVSLSEAFGGGLSAILNEAINASGKFIDDSVYGRSAPPPVAPPGAGPGTGGERGTGGISEPKEPPEVKEPEKPDPSKEPKPSQPGAER